MLYVNYLKDFMKKKMKNHKNQSIFPKNLLFFLFLYLPKYGVGNQNFFYPRQISKQLAFSLTKKDFFAASNQWALRYPFVVFVKTTLYLWEVQFAPDGDFKNFPFSFLTIIHLLFDFRSLQWLRDGASLCFSAVDSDNHFSN